MDPSDAKGSLDFLSSRSIFSSRPVRQNDDFVRPLGGTELLDIPIRHREARGALTDNVRPRNRGLGNR